MNIQQALATCAVTAVAFGALTFMPASADSFEPATKGDSGAVVLNAAETPQNLVWDMSCGEQMPARQSSEPSTIVAADALAWEHVSDVSFG